MESEAFDRANEADKQVDTLTSELRTVAEEAQELRQANTNLLGHQNSKQKIQQHLKLKEEINQLQDQLRDMTKENLGLVKQNDVLRDTLGRQGIHIDVSAVSVPVADKENAPTNEEPAVNTTGITPTATQVPLANQLVR